MTRPDSSRRRFLASSAAGAAAIAASHAVPLGAFAEGRDVLKVGVIGCGGRGTGAAQNCLDAHPSVKIVALADAFQDRVDGCRDYLNRIAVEEKDKYGGRVDLPPERCFTGYESYRQVLATDCDLVILASPPGFRPDQILAAANAGKHIFAEKPVAVDPVGIRKVLEASRILDAKKKGFVTGTQRRHQKPYVEMMKAIADGVIGDVVTCSVYWNQGALWKKDRTPTMTDLEWQARNWLYFTWLSGDHIVEQHVHNLDVMCWAMGGPPTKCTSLGGRQVRTDAAYGHIFDHFAVDFEWADGRHAASYSRQIDGSAGRVGEYVAGTKGHGWTPNRLNAWGASKTAVWTYEGGDYTDPYVQEHIDLIASIRDGKPLNEATRIAESNLVAIMARMAAYTGQEVSYDFALNKSMLDTFPKDLASGKIDVPPVAVPGRTRLA